MLIGKIKKDKNKNKEITQIVNNQNIIKKINSTKISKLFQQLDFNLLNPRD